MNLTIRQLKAFLAVANLKSFTAASHSLFITQGAISSLIHNMEDQIGLYLFDRTSRVVILSPDGRNFLPIAQRVVDEYTRAENYARDLGKLRKSIVRIVGAPLISCAILPRIISQFNQINSHICVELIDKPMSQLQQSIILGEADFGVGPERYLETDLKSDILFTTLISVYCSQYYPLFGRIINWQDIKSEHLIAVGDESIPFISSDIGILINPKMIVNHMATAMSIAAEGLGIVIAGEFSQKFAKGYGLIMCHLKPDLNRNMNIYSHLYRKLSPAAEIFKDFLFQYLIEHNVNSHL